MTNTVTTSTVIEDMKVAQSRTTSMNMTTTSAATMQNNKKRETVAQQENSLVDNFLDYVRTHRATQEDIDIVHAQLNRFPRGMVSVAARCMCNQPLVVVTRPQLEDGTPFPTTFYLTNPTLVKAVSRLEADGYMAILNDELKNNETLRNGYLYAHETYKSIRHTLAQWLKDNEEHIADTTAGGMPSRVKCLHALVAQSLALGSGVNPIGDKVLHEIRHEFSVTRCNCMPLQTL